MLLVSDFSAKVSALLVKLGIPEEHLNFIHDIDPVQLFKWTSSVIQPTLIALLFIVIFWQKRKLYSYRRRYGRM
ncbi:hypothetical protein [Solitalea canadensis]|uniref:Uncharacterized protein n=1 Tax=Solitalea canadensis (strain ATCC 29591 / DSM 3403 / JCM 21819 / LMG 8368 / NBRC 15130 / NCIMB 12057 / USAM 9D) TaxID=929556 RepID=H8KXS4_SOLCM|nr:hypothetical protein [Solitalea canadensis]AFD05489.1 hypothetical protein Solca_0348 [Solitalea canadensis DSM 3403]